MKPLEPKQRYACGHFVPDHVSISDWRAERTECPKCRAELAREYSDLEGTDKQITWAESIRDRMLRMLRNYRNVCPEFRQPAVDKAIETIRQTTDAEWFIDNRFRPSRQLVVMLGERS